MNAARPQGGLILALDTAMAGCAVGLYDPHEQKTLASLQEPMITGQAERLMPMIEQVLENAEKTYQDLAVVACTRGPGAFTGLRIGLAAAKGLALALDIPVVGVETFDALLKTLERRKTGQGDVAILMETKRNDYYARFYDAAGKPVTKGASCTLQELLMNMEKLGQPRLAGDSVKRFIREARQSGQTPGGNITEIIMCDPAAVAQCASHKIARTPQERAIDTNPLYLRAPDVTAPAQP